MFFDIQPLDSLLHYYGKITNIIARSEKIKYFSADDIDTYFSELITCKKNVERWKTNLSSNCEPDLLPITDFDYIQNPEMFQKYPYKAQLTYKTGWEGKTKV